MRDALAGCDALINFAAESHVDRSIDEPGHFIQTEVYGTYVLLEAARDAGIGRYVQVSTDEVYGSIEEGSFTEQSPLDPSSPYSASKAGGDLLVSAYCHTYGMDAIVCRASNNYGPYQYPEKLIPLCVLNALHGDPLPVYGDGMQVRNWLHVSDHCRGLDVVLRGGKAGETYNIGGPDELPNMDVVRTILRADRPRRVADPVREGPPRPRPALLAELGEDDCRPGLEGRRSGSRRASRRPSTGTATTPGGGSRSAPASIATTTSASTGRSCAPSACRMAFERIDTKIDGLVLVQPKVITDDRGFFFETYRRNEYAALGIDVEFVQDNHSRSVRGTIRALHFQLQPGQAKLIRCARGSIYDVAVDLRKESPTYGQHEAFVLSDKNAQQAFIPVGFAHGFCVTSEEADVAYKVSSYYDGADRARHRLGRPRDRRAVAGGASRSSPIATAPTRGSRRSPTSSPGESPDPRRGPARAGTRSTGGDLDAVLSYIHPDVEWRPALGPGGMEGNVYRGKAAYERWLREELPEVWENFRGEDLEFTELPGGRVLLLGYLHGRGRASGAEVRVPFGQLARFRDGLVVSFTAIPTTQAPAKPRASATASRRLALEVGPEA